MSAALSPTADNAANFNAHIPLAGGAYARISAPTLQALSAIVALLQVPAANQPTISAPGPTAAPVAAPAATPAPTAAPQAQPEGNASASTGTPASAQDAGAGSAGSGDAPRFTYDDVKARVLKLAKDKGRDVATKVLAAFGVDNANKLKLEQYAAFIAQADEALAAKA